MTETPPPSGDAAASGRPDTTTKTAARPDSDTGPQGARAKGAGTKGTGTKATGTKGTGTKVTGAKSAASTEPPGPPSGWSKLDRRQRIGVVAPLVFAGLVVLAAAGYSINEIINHEEPSPEPVDVLLIGDSIMNQGGVYLEEAINADLAEAAAAAGEEPGEVRIHNEAINGSGLLHRFEEQTDAGKEFTDWTSKSSDLMAEIDPDVVIVLFVGNYTSGELYVNRAGLEVEGYTDQFFEAWEDEARAMQQFLDDYEADIYWVNPPPMLDDELVRRVEEFQGINRRIAEDWTGTVLVDGTRVLSNDDGSYAFELPDETGVLQQVRSTDSVHLAPYGQRILAEEIARQVVPSIIASHRASLEE